MFWIMTSCCLVGSFRRFEASYCLHLQGQTVQKVSSSLLFQDYSTKKAKAVRTFGMAETAPPSTRRHIPQHLFFKGKVVPVRVMKTCGGTTVDFKCRPLYSQGRFLVPLVWQFWTLKEWPVCSSCTESSPDTSRILLTTGQTHNPGPPCPLLQLHQMYCVNRKLCECPSVLPV